jgi:hypothetical protein
MKEIKMKSFPRVEPSPYLWTRIEAGIAAKQRVVHPALQWSLSILAGAMLTWCLSHPNPPKGAEGQTYHSINFLYGE